MEGVHMEPVKQIISSETVDPQTSGFSLSPRTDILDFEGRIPPEVMDSL